VPFLPAWPQFGYVRIDPGMQINRRAQQFRMHGSGPWLEPRLVYSNVDEVRRWATPKRFQTAAKCVLSALETEGKERNRHPRLV
jgi:hypothetical protein